MAARTAAARKAGAAAAAPNPGVASFSTVKLTVAVSNPPRPSPRRQEKTAAKNVQRWPDRH